MNDSKAFNNAVPTSECAGNYYGLVQVHLVGSIKLCHVSDRSGVCGE